MATGLNRLKPLQITKAKPGDRLSDGGGLYLICNQGNGKSRPKAWAFYYFAAPGKRRELGLGSLEDMPLDVARELAAKLRAAHAIGADPKTERDRLRDEAKAASAPADTPITFRQVAQQYVADHKAAWRNAKHAQQWKNTLETYAYPEIGELAVADVDVPDVLRVLKPIWTAKPETAARLRGRIEAVLDYAKGHKWRSGENPARWKGTLQPLLPSKAKVQRVEHHNALPYADLPGFIAGLSGQPGVAAMALRFAVLTAARTGEVIGARWGEIDLDAAVWTIPGERMKAGREHRAALSTAAVELLRALAEVRVSDYVFPGLQRDKPLSNMAMLETLRRMKMEEKTTVHGLRSTFRDWAAEQTSHPREVIEAALAHVNGDRVEAAYLRTDFFTKRRDLMETWGRFAMASEAPAANVVPLRASA